MFWLRDVVPGRMHDCLRAGVILFSVWFPSLMMPLTWRPSSMRLLAGQPWREATVRVLHAPGAKLSLANGECVRVTVIPRSVREVVVRAGKVWLVGPDAKGRLVVRVDGLLALWPARRIPLLRATAAQPTNESIPRMALGPLTSRRRSVFT